jgi:autotransporter translocation and assembly factor TamB
MLLIMVGTLGALGVIVAGVLWVGLSSGFAARKLIGLGLARAGPAVTIHGVKGRLGGPLLLTGIVVKKPAFTASVDSVLLEWSPTDLLHRQMRIDRLQIAGVHVVLPDSAPAPVDTARPQRPHLPLDVVLSDVALRRLTVAAPGGVRVSDGAARITGHADNYRLGASAVASLPKLKQVKLELDARGNLEHLNSAAARVDLLDGTVTASGPVRWWPRIGWDLVIRAQDIKPGMLLEQPAAWPGSVMFNATTAGVLDSTGPAGHAALDSLGGTLRQQPLSGHLRLSFADSVYRVEALTLGWGSAQLAASGTVADTLSVRYRVTVANLATALRGSAGSLAAQGTAEGPKSAARIRLELQGKRLAYGTNRLGRLGGRADLVLAPDGRTDAQLRADRVRAGAQPIDSVVFDLRGTRTRHNATASLAAPSMQLALAAHGGLQDQTWNGRITDLAVRGTSVGGAWRLAQPARLSASSKSATLESLCLGLDEHAARVCAGGHWRSAAGWRATGSTERLPLALADSFLPRGRALSGTLDGRFDVSTIGGALTGSIAVAGTSVAMTYPEASGARLVKVALDTAAVEIHAGERGVHGTMSVRASNNGRASIGGIAARFVLPGYRKLAAPRPGQPVEAHVEGGISDLSVARSFTQAVDSIGGQVKLGLDVAGTIGAPRADGSVQLRELRAWLPGNRGITGGMDATLHAVVAPSRRLNGRLTIRPRDLRLIYERDSTISQFVVDGKGVEAQVDSGGARGEMDLGLRDTTNVRLAILSGALRLPEYTSTREQLRRQPVALRVAAEVPDLAFARGFASSLDSLTGRAAVELSAEGTAAVPHVSGRLRLENLLAKLRQGTRLSGAVDGDLRAAVAADSTLTAEVRLAPRNGTIEYAAAGASRRVTVDSSGLRIVAGKNGVHGTLDLHLGEARHGRLADITGRLALPQYTKFGRPLPPQPVEATLVGRVDDLSFAQGFTTDIDSVTGRVSLDVDVRGTAGKPQMTGGLRVLGVAANVPRAGLRLRELQLSAQGDQAGAVTIDGRLRSGRGWLMLRGKSPVRPTPKEPGRLRIEGDSVEAMNTSEIRVLVSPRIGVALAGDSLDVEGDLRIPYARIELSEIPATAVPPTDDVVFTDTVASKAKRQRVTARVRVLLGDSISFKGFNFTADLGGDLLAVSVPGRPATGSGTITIRQGHYKAYGQDLTISDGRLRFAGGPVDNPGLDIKATRTAEDSVTAGVKIAGTLKAPQVTIFSEPPMSQERALQYLVLGHPLGQSGGTQGNLASQAATSLGLRGGNLLAKTVGRGVGLDQAQIETKGDLQQASFVAGKYLSPNLYVSYGIGLFDPVSTLRLRYILSSKWTLQAETGEATGADLLYRVEAGRGPSHE